MRGFPVHRDTTDFAENNLYLNNPGTAPACPPLDSDAVCDVCIIGAGLTGLSTAQELAKRNVKTVILERHAPGWGASGRNGGQLWPGFFSRLQDAEKKFGKVLMKSLWDLSNEGINALRNNITTQGVACEFFPGSVWAARTEKHARDLDGYITMLEKDYSYRLDLWDRAKIETALGTTYYRSGVHDPLGGALQPLQYANGLATLVAKTATIHGETPATDVKRDGDGWRIITPRGTVRAKKLVFSGDSYLGDLFPQLRRKYVLIRNAMVATRPRTGTFLPISVCEYDDYLQFFRNTRDGRLIFGGGDTIRPLMSPVATQNRITRSLEENISHIFPELSAGDITHRWGGYIGITSSFLPNVGRVDKHTYYANGYSGHGLGLTHAAGRAIAESIFGDHKRIETFEKVRNMALPGIDRADFLFARLGMMLYDVKNWWSH